MNPLKPRLFLIAATAAGLSCTDHAHAQLSVDNNDRAAVSHFYRTHFGPANRNVTPSWTGSANGCNDGTIDQAFVDATVQRINAYRALMDRPNVTYSDLPFQVDGEQRAALLMQISGQVGQRSMPNSFPCWTQNVNWHLARSMQDAAVGTDAIDRAMRGDTGQYDQSILMQPVQRRVRIGSTDSHMLVNFPPETNVFPNTGSVAWPGNGYLPYQLTPDRWRFNAQSLPWDASNTTRHDNFSQAQVSVTRNGVPLRLVTEFDSRRPFCWSGIGWRFAPGQLQHGPGMGDVTYQVSITGVGGFVSSYSYSVTVFDPTPPGTFTTFGRGCGLGAGATLAAAPGSRPAIGATFQVLLDGVAERGNLAVVNLGLTRQSIDLSGLGLTGCSLYSDIQFSLPGILTRSAQPFDLPLPNDPTLLGGRAYLQGAAFDLGVNAAGIVTTNGGTMVLGS